MINVVLSPVKTVLLLSYFIREQNIIPVWRAVAVDLPFSSYSVPLASNFGLLVLFLSKAPPPARLFVACSFVTSIAFFAAAAGPIFRAGRFILT